MFSIKGPKDFWTGVMFIGFGTASLLIARTYPFGTTGRMGAGYFPTILSGLLVFFGILSLLRGLRLPGEPIGKFAWKPILIICASVAALGLLLPGAGMVIALIILTLGCATASNRFCLDRTNILITAGLTVFCVLVFVKGLGLPMPILGTWFGQ